MLPLIDKIESFLNKSDLKRWLNKLGSKEWIDQVKFQTIREKIEKEVPKLLVCGCTSAGKSSMLNVLLGEELLPVGHDSATSVLCEICYTEKRDEKAAIVYLRKGSKERKQKLNLCDAKDRSLFQDYLLNGRDSSKHPKDANEEEDCFRVEMLLHLDFLQGIVLVDSPGVTADSDLAAKVNLLEHCRHNTHCGVVYVLDPSARSSEEASKAGGLVQAFIEESDSFTIASSALFVANKWDLVEQEQIVHEVLLQHLAKLWPGFQEHQLVTISSKLSARYLAVGEVDSNVETLCKGIADVLAFGVENIIVEAAKLCLDLLQFISDAVHRTLRSFNMRPEKRDAKWNRDRRCLERQQNDYKNGKLGDMVKQLQSKIASFSQCLESCYKSGELEDTITMLAQEKSKQLKDFTASDQRKIVGFFIVETLMETIENRIEYTEIKNWCENDLEVMKACADVGLRLPDVSTRNSTSRASLDHCISGSSKETMLERFSLSKLATLLRLPPRFVKLLVRVSTLGFYDLVKIIPNYVINDLHGKRSFEQQVTKYFNEYFLSLLCNNKAKLNKLLEELLSNEVLSVKLLLDDVPQKLAKDFRDLNILAQQDELHANEYKRLLDETTDIWNQLAETVVKLNIHKWRKDSLTTLCSKSSETSYATSTLEDEIFDARLQPSTLAGRFDESVVVEIVNQRSTSTIEMQKILTVALHSFQLRHENIIKVFGSVLLESETSTVGLLFEQCMKVQASNEIFSRDEQSPRKLERVNEMALQLTNAICFLHDRAIVFGGFKTDDLKISSDGVIKLVPPPFSKPLWSLTSNLESPFHNDVTYVAPEVLSHYLYDESADVYSLGIILTEIWNGRRAYDADETSLLETVLEFKDKVESGEMRPRSIIQLSETYELLGSEKALKSLAVRWQDLVDLCWNNESAERPTAAKVREKLAEASQAS
ncbi:uncharacterized protein LOC134195513 isoform X2 [Corticium candelabrum]|nr:uncharacterized protein LOC134195513 isoform X2 [Corticium candelabrum]